MLEVKDLKKTYGGFSLSFGLSVDQGETLALVGPSGSGKTTALNLIAGLAESESGSITIDGKDITGLPPWKRNISVVFQDLALFPHLDVDGNIAYGLFIRGVPKKERRQIVEETLELVRLSGFASRRIHTLSGGERQRVAIARALASKPDAMLLDEPFSSLDAPLRKNMRREFLEIRSNSPAPCIFVTHDREEAVMLGNKIALMEEGRIVETGTGRELFLEPKTESAARFFGAGEVLPCEIMEESGSLATVSSPLGILKVPVNPIRGKGGKKLFVPHDAVTFDKKSESAELKSFAARFTGSIFEGHSLTIKLLPGASENKNAPGTPNDKAFESSLFEVIAAPRTRLPSCGSIMTLWLDQSLLRLVMATSPRV